MNSSKKDLLLKIIKLHRRIKYIQNEVNRHKNVVQHSLSNNSVMISLLILVLGWLFVTRFNIKTVTKVGFKMNKIILFITMMNKVLSYFSPRPR